MRIGPLALVAVFALVLAASAACAATADAAPRWIAKDLPFSPALTHRLAVVPLAPPSPEHPLGTVAIVTPDAVYAWDLEARRFLTGRSLGATNGQDAAVVAVRADDEIFVLAGSCSESPGSNEVVLLTLGLDLAVRSRDVIGRGILPSLAISDRWIVAGAFEQHASTGPLRLAFHAVVLSRATRAVVGARVFQGERLVTPGMQPDAAMHAIVVRDDRAYFSLTGIAEATELPALHVAKTAGKAPTAGPRTPDGCAPLISAWDHPVGVCGGDESTGEPMRIRFRR